MALHSRWTSGDIEFYDGTQTVCIIPKSGHTFVFGESGEGVDVKWYGDTTGAYVLFDESADLVDFHGINITYRDPANQTSSGNITLTSTSNRIQFLKTSSTGGINVILPAAATANAGIEFKIFNNSTGGDYPMTVKNGSSTGATVVTLQQNEGGIVISDGSTWKGFVGGIT